MVNSEATREQIIRTASELFAEHGRAGASVRAIAQTAEVNGAMISHYFGRWPVPRMRGITLS